MIEYCSRMAIKVPRVKKGGMGSMVIDVRCVSDSALVLHVGKLLYCANEMHTYSFTTHTKRSAYHEYYRLPHEPAQAQ